jgi:hypothetical protein
MKKWQNPAMRVPIFLVCSLLWLVQNIQKPRLQFTDYAVKDIYRGEPAPPIIYKDCRMNRTVIRNDAEPGVEFSGSRLTTGSLRPMTAIALVRTEQFIVIAAESASVDGAGQPGPPQCKIFPVGNFFYTANKFTGDTVTGYNLHKLIMGDEPHESLESLATAVRSSVRQPLLKALIAMKQQRPNEFRKNFDSMQVVGIYLAGISHGRPSLINMEFNLHDVTASQIELDVIERYCPGPDCEGGIAFPFVGPSDLREKFMSQRPNYWQGSAEVVAKNLEALVQMFIDDGQSHDFGPPISVLIIKPTGPEWVKRGLCVDSH